MINLRFRPPNSHHQDPEQFAARDSQLSILGELPLVHQPGLLDSLPIAAPGIYSITGGLQVGKTTLLKQWMERLLGLGVAPLDIVYVTGELIDDHHSLVAVMRDILERGPIGACSYLLIDEVTYIREWDRGVKFLADAGLLRRVELVLTGSDTVLLRDARLRLPGRRDTADLQDFHLYPLSFHDVVRLRKLIPTATVQELVARPEALSEQDAESLRRAFDQYLVTGGYLGAINEMQARNSISPSVYAVYFDWIRGDVLTVLPALVEDRLAGAPKKARKVVISDPFVLHAVRSWLEPCADPFGERTLPLLADPEWTGRLAELCADTHHARLHPTYYIKEEGEVDIAYVTEGRFWPIEVKWSGQVRSGDLKQLRKYPNARIATRDTASTIHGVPNELLPLHLLRLGPSPHVAAGVLSPGGHGSGFFMWERPAHSVRGR